MDTVHDERAHRDLRLEQAAGEEVGFLDGVPARRRHEHERGLRRRQQLEHGHRSMLEAFLHPGEGREEGDGIVDHLGTHDLRQRAHECLRRHVGRLHHTAGRRHQDAVEAMVEESRQAARRVEKVERMPRRWRVDDDEIELAGDVQLVELLHRHVFLST